MAKVNGNVFMNGVSGGIGGQMVLRRRRDGSSVVAVAPRRNSARVITGAQAEQQARFKSAVVYARGARLRPEYEELALARQISTFNVALADYLSPPQVDGTELDGYAGQPGRAIRIVATDDVRVASVEVVITAAGGALVERGPAIQAPENASSWSYTTTQQAPAGPLTVLVVATDLAGRRGERTTTTP